MVLETERLILRNWNENDAEELYRIASDKHVGPQCGWAPHKDIAESRSVLKNLLINEFTFAIVLKESNAVIGNISIMPKGVGCNVVNENEAEIGFWLGYPYWGKGYMPEACMRMIRYGFETLKLEKIWCAHNSENHNSHRVQEKCGFKYSHTKKSHSDIFDKEIDIIVNCIDSLR